MSGRRVMIAGLGNVLMGDDGAGPYAIELMRARWTVPEAMAIEDLGTPGLDLTPHIAGLDVLILVDTVRAEAPPGSIRVYEKDALLRGPVLPRFSPHDPALRESLTTLELAGIAPREAVLVGMVPERCELGTGLTPALRSAVDDAVREVRRQLDRFGCTVEENPDGAPDLWWEAAEAV